MGPEIASLELAAAISNAGGLGMISFGGYAPVALKERISKLRTLTSKPFGVNVLLQGPLLPLPDSAFVDVCLDERVPVLSFFWGASFEGVQCTIILWEWSRIAVADENQTGVTTFPLVGVHGGFMLV